MGDKTVRTEATGFRYFSTSSYSFCIVTTVQSLASLSQNPRSRVCSVREAEERRKRRGTWGRCLHALQLLCRACTAALLNSCTSPCTSLSPFAFCSSPSTLLLALCLPLGTAFCIAPRALDVWKCPADGAKPVGNRGGQKAWKNNKLCW